MQGNVTIKMLLPALLCLLAVQFHCSQAQRTSRKPIFVNTDAIREGRRISEDTPTGTVIGTVSARDPDGGPITYKLDEGAASVLEIDPSTGQIKIKAQLDFERNPTLTITVIAEDMDGDTTEFGSSLQIDDANDLDPYFTQTYYNFNLQENTTVGTTITKLQVKDDDTSNSVITVTCDDNTAALAAACRVFGVQDLKRSNEYWNGTLILLSPLNYETAKSYSVRLIANDGANVKLQEIQIGVIDINDSPPFFVRAQGSVIPEGRPVGSYIDYVSARDTDEVDNRPIRYELYGDPEAVQYFRVDSLNGTITNIKDLDYEDPARTPGDEFTLQIRARELLDRNTGALGNDPVTTATAVVTIRLTDVNDNCPKFDKDEFFVTIREDIAQGSNIPLQMTVTDRDSGPRSTFNLQLFDPSGTFEVTPTSGRSPASVTISVVRAANIDFERPPTTYDLTVRAIENGANIEPLTCDGRTVVHITVEDVNDENPQFARDLYRGEVREDARQGTSIITITATDLDSGIFGTSGLRYYLIGSGENLFTINPISGVVTVAFCSGTYGVVPCIDYETKTSYDLAVQASDSLGIAGNLQGTTTLRIDVLDVNDNKPRFNTEYIRSIREGETVTTDPLLIRAIDPDGGAITYSIPPQQQEAQYWTIDPITGNITATKPIQYSDLSNPQRGSFKFQAMASDGQFNTLANVTINVIDVNDHAPIFLPRNYTVSIREDIPGDSFVIIVTCSDEDSPTTGNGQVDVSIDEGSFGKFTVRSNGTLNDAFRTEILTSPDANFDYDTKSRYTLLVKARDRGSPSNTGTTYVFVTILDTNNKNPYFDPPTTSVSVSENRPVGWLVTTVTAKDNDADNQLEIQFRNPDTRAFNPSGVEVTNRNLFQDLFSIDRAGNVRVNSSLDRDVVNFMTFVLYVQDTRVNPPQEGFGALFIRILEYNDQAPQFELPFYNLSVLEERPLSTFVGSILARDEDDQIRAYRLESNPGNLFTISLTSGVLQVNGRLDYEMQHNVTLVAEAADSGSPSLRNTTTVFINIININDNTPIFNQTVYQISILEHSNRTDALVRVSASDRDEGDYGVVRYDSDDKYFSVDTMTGDIFLKPGAVLDRESETTYTFQVTAYDSPNNPSVRLNTTAPVYIILQDKNDNCPEFDQPNDYSGVVIETADIGDQVVELFAKDRDSGINRRILFTIDIASARPSIAFDLFSIQSIQSDFADKESGRIEVKTSLRNRPGVYNFTVIASDRNGDNSTGDMCSTRVPVTVRVQEAINDSPVWVKPPSSNFSIDVLESQYNGMLVYDCRAVDVNTGEAGIIDYSFNVQRELTQATPEFQINAVTCVIRAQIVYDREQVESYVLTLVAKDRGDPSASSETVLIVNVLDVNDNDPEFPMRNGETIPYDFDIPEGSTPAEVGVIGTVSATDKDTDHKNNKVFYRIVAGNDDNLFNLNREKGDLTLNPNRAPNGLNREAIAEYSMDVLAYNEVNDDSVIRNRRKRSTNPSIVTVNVRVEDLNDTPPRFTNTDYYGCVARDARYGQSILKVEAVDEDLNRAASMQYTKVSESTGDYFIVDSTLGVVRNRRLLQDIGSRQPIVSVQADDNSDTPQKEPGSTAITDVKIFVTDRSDEVVLKVSQPSADVRYYKDQLIRAMQNSSTQANSIKYVCIREIRDRVNDDGTTSFTASDVFVSAVGQNEAGNYFIHPGGDLRRIVLAQMNDEKSSFNYRTMYVQNVVTDTESDEFELTEDPVLAIFIIAILLIFLAILLFCLACCLIRNSKKKKIKKLRAEEHTHVEVVRQQPPEVVTSVNPVYDNKGFTGGDEYAVVQKPYRPQEPIPVSPPIVPVMVPAVDDGSVDVYIAEPIPEVPAEPVDFDEPEEPEPVIITEPIMSDETPQQMAPPPDDFFDPEPVIETEVLPDDELPGISEDPDDVIEVEFGDSPPVSPPDSPPDSPPFMRTSPPRSDSSSPPPPAPDSDEYRIEADVM